MNTQEDAVQLMQSVTANSWTQFSFYITVLLKERDTRREFMALGDFHLNWAEKRNMKES